MKKGDALRACSVIVSAWCAGATLAAGAPPDAALYGRAVCFEPGAGATLQGVAGTLVNQLQEMTGVEFGTTTTNTAGPGIFLLRSAPDLAVRYPSLDSQQADLTNLAARGPEAFLLYSTGTNRLFIVGNSDGALRLGMYDYLRRLGWRALLPGSNWTIRPLLDSITLNIDSVHEPTFRQRSFFGTGGFGPVLPLDPTGQVAADWSLWQSENFFGGTVSISGHAGEDFNARNKAVLDANWLNDPHDADHQMMAYNDDSATYPGWQWQFYNASNYPGVKPNTGNPALQVGSPGTELEFAL